MDNLNLAGIIPAVVVPMRRDYSIDYDTFRHYLEWIASLNIVGIAVNVDTGEGPYLTHEERIEIIRITKAVSAGRCAVVTGVGGPSTPFAISNAVAARDAGADALLVFPTPAFLNDPLDERIAYQYHKAIADASKLPLVVFQLGPVFGGVDYPPKALAKVLELPEVIALKDASFNAQRFSLTRDIVRQADHPITLLTGNDNFLLESFLLGAQGGLLGYGAVGAPWLIKTLDSVREHRFKDATALQERTQGFCDYIYARPFGDYRARCKVALVHMGFFTPEQTFVRSPFLSLWDSEKEAARQAVEAAGLLGIGNQK